MAVCGRCWLCRTKFSCKLTDVGAVVRFVGEDSYDGDLNDGGRKLCTSCVKAIDDDYCERWPAEPHGDGMPFPDRVGAIVAALVRSRG
jgi:hypothetical protein